MQQAQLTSSIRTSNINFLHKFAAGGRSSAAFSFLFSTNQHLFHCAKYTYIFNNKNLKLLQSTIFKSTGFNK